VTKRGLFDSLRAFFAGEGEEESGYPPPAAAAPSADPGSPGGLIADDWQKRIPRSSLQRVVAIRDAVRGLEKETASRGLQTELDELGRIKDTHLPRLIQSYIEIPAQHRADVFRETGRSASFLLNESLDKMLGRLRDMSAQLARGNITTFAENVRFVELYYEQNKGPFES